jgi:hypothetical protein
MLHSELDKHELHRILNISQKVGHFIFLWDSSANRRHSGKMQIISPRESSTVASSIQLSSEDVVYQSSDGIVPCDYWLTVAAGCWTNRVAKGSFDGENDNIDDGIGGLCTWNNPLREKQKGIWKKEDLARLGSTPICESVDIWKSKTLAFGETGELIWNVHTWK